jgi:hypothetical protein
MTLIEGTRVVIIKGPHRSKQGTFHSVQHTVVGTLYIIETLDLKKILITRESFEVLEEVKDEKQTT